MVGTCGCVAAISSPLTSARQQEPGYPHCSVVRSPISLRRSAAPSQANVHIWSRGLLSGSHGDEERREVPAS